MDLIDEENDYLDYYSDLELLELTLSRTFFYDSGQLSSHCLLYIESLDDGHDISSKIMKKEWIRYDQRKTVSLQYSLFFL